MREGPHFAIYILFQESIISMIKAWGENYEAHSSLPGTKSVMFNAGYQVGDATLPATEH